MICRLGAILGTALAITTPATAQSDDVPLQYPLARVLALADLAHLDRAGFQRALGDVLPIAAGADGAPASAPIDPFLWSLSGSFGGEGAHPRPGAIFACARYGLATRDLFAEHGLASSRTFALMRIARPQFDDTEAWPEGAVARLYCAFVWDDARVVAIMPERPARRALASVFTTLVALPQDGGTLAVYGDGGYRIDASGTAADSVVQGISARMTLTLGHQSLSLRSFLMGGGF